MGFAEPPRPAEIGDRVRLKSDVDTVGVVDSFADIDGIRIALVQYPSGLDMVPVADIEIEHADQPKP